MPRPTIIERARKYVAAMPPGVSGSGRHNATVAVANVLLHGFGLQGNDAWALLVEFNERCQPPSSEAKLRHRLEVSRNFQNDGKPRGWLCDANDEYGKTAAAPAKPAPKPRAKAEYDPERLKRFSGHWAQRVDLVWLANRSAIDPATVDSEGFLKALYAPNENVLIFNKCNREGAQVTQGEAMWPAEPPPTTGQYGVWFLPQPVDGQYHPNPRNIDKKTGNAKSSRRSEESVTDWRYLVLESDSAPLREWLGVLVQLPLKICAIYTSGGRSVHALVRVNAKTKGQWDEMKSECFSKDAAAGRFLVTNGLDVGVLSAVRLSRLPGAMREGKVVNENQYLRFERPELQKLLYICPSPRGSALVDMLPVRNVEDTWVEHASHGISDADETGGAWLKHGLRYYARVSERIRAALTELRDRATA